MALVNDRDINQKKDQVRTPLISKRMFFCRNEKVQIVQKLFCTTMLYHKFCISNVFRASTYHFMKKKPWSKWKKIFYLVFTEMQMYGRRHETRTLPWSKCQIFLETLFICNDIDENLNNPCIVKLSLFQTVILIFPKKKSKIKNGPRQDTPCPKCSYHKFPNYADRGASLVVGT